MTPTLLTRLTALVAEFEYRSKLNTFTCAEQDTYMVCANEVSSILADSPAGAEAEEQESKLRYLLWCAHPHEGKYGDDGEMQCNARGCMIDFKRNSADEIERKIVEANVRLLAESQAAPSAEGLKASARERALVEAGRAVVPWTGGEARKKLEQALAAYPPPPSEKDPKC